MEDRFIEVLQCPECRKSDFEIFIFAEGATIRYAWDGNGQTKIDKINSTQYKDGIILCHSCGSWYPVINDITVMLRMESRDNQKDKEFLETYKNNIPEEIYSIYK